MAVFNEPTKWARALGATANADVIPDEAGATDVDISKIFPAVFSVPLSQGGKAIPRRTLNGLLKLLGDWLYYYQQGGVASYSNTVDYVAGRVVSHNGSIWQCLIANGADEPKEPVEGLYWTKVLTLADIVAEFANTDLSNLSQTGLAKIIPTSTILPFAGSTVPNGWLLCNGAAVSRMVYADLFEVIGTVYGAGDGSTTFNLPDMRNRYPIGAGDNALGTKVAEQLPNITGDINFHCAEGAPTGAIYNRTGITSASWEGNPIYRTFALSLDAAKSNAIYTDNGKVHPASLALNFIIKT